MGRMMTALRERGYRQDIFVHVLPLPAHWDKQHLKPLARGEGAVLDLQWRG